MKLSKETIKELDSLKQKIERIESNIGNAKSGLELATELENIEEIKELNNAIEFGLREIKGMVEIQAESMKLEFNLVLDLIFDREYTLSKI